MYAVSRRFLNELSRDHTAVTRLDVVQGSDVLTLEPLDGNVRVDFDSSTRRAMSARLVTELGYDEFFETLDPLKSVLRPWRGIRFSDGTEELVPLGDFYLDRLVVSESDDGAPEFKISGLDASSRCMRPLGTPFTISGGKKFVDVIPPLLQRALPGLAFRIRDTAWTLPSLILTEDRVPWTEARNLALNNGQDLWLARDGVADTATRPIEADDEPTATFIEGETATFWSPEREYDATQYPNVIVVTGTNSANDPVRGSAWDNNPQSPTYRYGDYGERVETIRTEIAKSNEQCAAMARTLLARKLGPQDQMTFECVPNPAIDEADTIAITRERMGLVDRRMLVSYIDCPFEPEGTMKVGCRHSIYANEPPPVDTA